jgi:hypothetical protein
LGGFKSEISTRALTWSDTVSNSLPQSWRSGIVYPFVLQDARSQDQFLKIRLSRLIARLEILEQFLPRTCNHDTFVSKSWMSSMLRLNSFEAWFSITPTRMRPDLKSSWFQFSVMYELLIKDSLFLGDLTKAT